MIRCEVVKVFYVITGTDIDTKERCKHPDGHSCARPTVSAASTRVGLQSSDVGGGLTDSSRQARNASGVVSHFTMTFLKGQSRLLSSLRLTSSNPSFVRVVKSSIVFSARNGLSGGTANHSGMPTTNVPYHIDRTGKLVKAGLVDAGPMGLVHDFVVTRKSLVILIQPFLFDPARAGQASVLDAHVWNPQAETRVLVVDKADFGKRRWHALPAHFGFHYGNAWEEADGTVRLDHCLADDPGIVTGTLRYVMKGEFRPWAPLRYAQIVLPPTLSRWTGDRRLQETSGLRRTGSGAALGAALAVGGLRGPTNGFCARFGNGG